MEPKANIKTWRQHVSNLLDRLEQKLFAGQRKSTRKAKLDSKKSAQIVSQSKRQLQLWFIGIASLIFVAGFVYAVYFYSNTIKFIERDPLVTNLTKAGVVTRIHFGSSPFCLSANTECWLDPDFDDSTWETMIIPTTDTRKTEGFKKNNSQGPVYYRTTLPVSQALIDSGKEMIYSPLFVDHKQYEIYINGNLVQAGQATTNASSIVAVPILRKFVHNNNVHMVIKASASPDEKGMSHFNSAYLGPKNALQNVYVISERVLQTYFLLFLLSKGSIFVVFALFYYFSIEKRALFHFLQYAFCVTAENLIASTILSEFLDVRIRVSLYFSLKAVALSSLLLFFLEYFQASRGRRYANYYIWLYALATAIFLVMNIIDPVYFPGTYLRQLMDVSQMSVLLLGVALGTMAIRQWQKHGMVANDKGKSFKMFVTVIAIYAGLLLWELTFNPFVGFDKRAVFDLIFFYFIAFTTAREFGFNAGQVITLEAHMIEKQRMELELNEAAEIAKAFLPGEPPQWDFCKVGVYHKSLSESSGDWFTFEESPSRQFCHLIMCDITGHGVQAALVVSTCRTVLSAMIAEDQACTETSNFIVHYARALNKILFTQGGGRHVSTLLGLTFDRIQQKVYYISAGQPNPLLVTLDPASQRKIIRPLTSRYTVLGVSASINYEMKCHDLQPGDEVIAYTDGIPVGTHIKELKSYIEKTTYELDRAPLDLYQRIWRAETEKTEKEPDDDVSIVWFKRVS